MSLSMSLKFLKSTINIKQLTLYRCTMTYLTCYLLLNIWVISNFSLLKIILHEVYLFINFIYISTYFIKIDSWEQHFLSQRVHPSLRLYTYCQMVLNQFIHLPILYKGIQFANYSFLFLILLFINSEDEFFQIYWFFVFSLLIMICLYPFGH